jgi:hypothetical protein
LAPRRAAGAAPAAAATAAAWADVMQGQASGSNSSSDIGNGSGCSLPNSRREATVLPAAAAASGGHSMGLVPAAVGARGQAAAGRDMYSPLSSDTAVEDGAAGGYPGAATTLPVATGFHAAAGGFSGGGFGRDVYSTAAGGAGGSPGQSQASFWAPAVATFGLQPPPIPQRALLQPPTAAQSASGAQHAAGAAAAANWVGSGVVTNAARAAGGLFGALQSPRRVLCVANRVLHHLLDLQSYLESAQQQQLLRYGSFSVLSAMSDWLQAAW